MDWLETILQAPLPTLLIVAGLTFMAIAIAGKLGNWVELNQGWQRLVAGALGGILLFTGIHLGMGDGMNTSGGGPIRNSPSPSTPFPSPTSSSTPTLTPTPTPSLPSPTTSPPTSPSQLSGKWQVSHQSSKSRFSLDTWEINHQNGILSIVEVNESVVPLPGDYRKELKVSNFTFNYPNLTFTTESDQSVTTKYNLTFINPDRIEGTFRSTDKFLDKTMGLGTIQDEGKIILTRGVQ